MTWKRDDLTGEIRVRQQLAGILGLPTEFSEDRTTRHDELSEAWYRLAVLSEALAGQFSELADNYFKASSLDDEDDVTALRFLRNQEGVAETLGHTLGTLAEDWQQ